MRTFVMSDIHGNAKALNDVLKQAEFKLGEDTLYVLGDMIDWGKDSWKVVMTLKDWQTKYHDKIFITKGNHECMCVSALKYKNALALGCWLSNNGMETYAQYAKLSDSLKTELLDWMEALPVKYEIDNYYLTHSSPLFEDAVVDKSYAVLHTDLPAPVIYAVWQRVYPDEKLLDSGKILISGHTITSYYNGSKNNCTVFKDLKNCYINIDCGAKVIGKEGYNGKLCLMEIPSYKVWYSEVF